VLLLSNRVGRPSYFPPKSVGGADDWRISIFLETSRADRYDWCIAYVALLPGVINKIHFLCSTQSSWSVAQLTPVNTLYRSPQPPKTLLVPTHVREFFQQLLCSVSFKQIQFFKINYIYFIERLTNVWKMCHFHYHGKSQSKVSRLGI